MEDFLIIRIDPSDPSKFFVFHPDGSLLSSFYVPYIPLTADQIEAALSYEFSYCDIR